jgi:cyclomaltodextrinase
MPELPENVANISTPVETNSNTASAPGDLPLPAIIERIAARRGQFRHDNTIVPFAPYPGQTVEIWATSGEELPIERAALFYTLDGSQPTASSSAIPLARVQLDWDLHAGYLTRWRAVLPAQVDGTIVRYRIGGWIHFAAKRVADQSIDHPVPTAEEPEIWAHDGQGFGFRFSGRQGITTFAFPVEEPRPQVPTWVRDAVIYQIFLDRFRTSVPDGTFAVGYHEPEYQPGGFHGGTLRGVCEALPYLAELGITCLWLSPLNPAESYHRYDTTDYYNVDPRLGTNEDLNALTSQAHALGMRVLLDFVPSHISWQHPAFLAAQRDPHAPSFDWFTFAHWPDRYRSFLEAVPSLPSLRTESEGVRAHVIGSAVQWLRDYGIDGLRLDHAIGHGMDFWTLFRQATHAVSSDVYLVGEATDTPDALIRYRGKLDGILDFPLASALRHTFALGTWNLLRFERFLTAYEQYMEAGPGRTSFLDNHDMDRFLALAGDNRARLQMAALCQFTLSAPPVIYYGTEVGMSQRPGVRGDEEARRDMDWTRASWDLDLLSFYQALVRMRRTTSVLREGKRCTVYLDEEQKTYAYLVMRGEKAAKDDLLVLFNLSETSQAIPLSPGNYRCLLATAESPLLNKTAVAIEIVLSPESGAAFLVE